MPLIASFFQPRARTTCHNQHGSRRTRQLFTQRLQLTDVLPRRFATGAVVGSGATVGSTLGAAVASTAGTAVGATSGAAVGVALPPQAAATAPAAVNADSRMNSRRLIVRAFMFFASFRHSALLPLAFGNLFRNSLWQASPFSGLACRRSP